jgi:glucoamylase
MSMNVNNGNQKFAPGWPGIAPKWTSSAKSGVGAAISAASRVWFALSHGIFNEIYYPRVDHACTRDLGLIVTDGRDFFSEEKRHARHEVKYVAEGVPAYRLVNTCSHGRYRIEKEIIAAPHRDAVLQRTRFTPLRGELEDYHLYALLAPHLGNRGWGNTAWVGDYKGVPMLFAERDGYALALACSAPWLKRSAGFAGVSDGWQDLSGHKQMRRSYERAENGNVALTGEIDLSACDGEFVLALGFGGSAAEAGQSALASVLDSFERAQAEFIHEWQAWQQRRHLPDSANSEAGDGELYRISLSVLRTHESKIFQGGLIASLSIPWGFNKGDEDLGGYHLVWPRDLVEAASGLLAAGARDEANRVLRYLMVTQEADGHWPQNMWMDGSAYWNGVQMDETALPILLADQVRREGAFLPPLGREDLTRLWPMVQRAAGYMVRNGPVTPQERWEMDPGYSPFTLTVEIAALLAAAEIAEIVGESSIGAYLRETADYWNANIERWIYVTDTDVDRALSIDGHYVRIAPPEKAEAASPRHGFVPIKGRAPGRHTGPASHIIGPDALALVRFGLRAADDPRIVNTVKAIDALLTGERAHYELAAGRVWEAEKLMRALESFANEGGMIPEQVWDADDIPEAELFRGKASGSAMPLVWAHAEYVKLRRSLRDGRVFDLPPQTVERYLAQRAGSPFAVWRFNNKCDVAPAGKTLRVETMAAAVIRWSADGWRTVRDAKTQDTGLGVHVADLPTDALSSGAEIVFTFYWPEAERWEGADFTVRLEQPG